MALNASNIKIIAVGDSGVGKTSCLTRFLKNSFSPDPRPTIACDILAKKQMLIDQEVSVVFWDTAGQERFKALNSKFYRSADVVIFIYDTMNPASFDHLEEWMEEFHKHSGAPLPDFPFFVFGNKADLKEESKEPELVPQARVQAWCAKHNNIRNFLVSAKTGAGVNEAMVEAMTAAMAFRKAHRREEPPQPTETVPIDKEEPKAGGCSC